MDIDELRYSVEHLWVRLDVDNRATIGVSEEAFGDQTEIKSLELPSEGDEIIKDEVFGIIRTVGAGLFRLYAPLSGDITEVNEEALDVPDVIVEDPYLEGWLIRVEFSNMTEFDDLMTRDEYEEFFEEEDLEEEEERELDDDEDEDDY